MFNNRELHGQMEESAVNRDTLKAPLQVFSSNLMVTYHPLELSSEHNTSVPTLVWRHPAFKDQSKLNFLLTTGECQKKENLILLPLTLYFILSSSPHLSKIVSEIVSVPALPHSHHVPFVHWLYCDWLETKDTQGPCEIKAAHSIVQIIWKEGRSSMQEEMNRISPCLYFAIKNCYFLPPLESPTK